MQSLRKYLPFALFAAFFALAILAFISSKPSPKNERIYKAVQQYSPYYLDRRLGGLTIKNKEDENFKEKPTNMTLFKEFERLERNWGKQHLKLDNNTLLILDNNGTTLSTLPLHTEKEVQFIYHYYGVN
ncbi:MAG TPA: hypothetical protein ENK39_00795 [Epsilonproteobacteria bacterium]|nr:hypothetical protein [Campylobacterota bacterium]